MMLKNWLSSLNPSVQMMSAWSVLVTLLFLFSKFSLEGLTPVGIHMFALIYPFMPDTSLQDAWIWMCMSSQSHLYLCVRGCTQSNVIVGTHTHSNPGTLLTMHQAWVYTAGHTCLCPGIMISPWLSIFLTEVAPLTKSNITYGYKKIITLF